MATVTNVFDRLIGQTAAEAELRAAARAARGAAARLDEAAAGAVSMFADPGGDPDGDTPDGGTADEFDAASRASMTHAWLFTGPPGSGRSVAATAFAAALQCQADDPADVGCGECRACVTVMAQTHADVRHVVPDGLSLSVAVVREIVQLASRRPGTGRWQIVIVEDADRLTESAANALLKVVEEPPARTVFLLCAPSVDPEDISVTLRSRCRHVALGAPAVDAIARVLVERDGIRVDLALDDGHAPSLPRSALLPAPSQARVWRQARRKAIEGREEEGERRKELAGTACERRALRSGAR